MNTNKPPFLFFEKNIILKTLNTPPSRREGILAGNNYPKECRTRDVLQEVNKCLQSLQPKIKLPKSKSKKTECLTKTIQNNKACQSALEKEARKNYRYNHPPEKGLELYEAETLLIGLPPTVGKFIYKGGKYILQLGKKFGGKILHFTKKQYKKIVNAIQRKKTVQISISPNKNIQMTKTPKGTISVKETFTNHKGRSATVHILENQTYISQGAYGSVSRVSAQITGKNTSKTVPFVLKKSFEYTPNVKPLLKKHKILQEAGIPTFRTYRVNEEGTKILSTPLNTKGAFALSPNNKFPVGFHPEKYHFSPQIIDSTIKKVSQIIEKAIKNNINLPPDSIFFIVKKKSIDPMIGDFDLITLSNTKSIPDPMMRHMEKVHTIDNNMLLYNSFMRVLGRISVDSKFIIKVRKMKEKHYNHWLDTINQ